MTASLGIIDLVRHHGYKYVKCPECGGMTVVGDMQDNGIWCDSSVLAERVNAIGKKVYAATCEESATKGICRRPHQYRCQRCDWTIIIE